MIANNNLQWNNIPLIVFCLFSNQIFIAKDSFMNHVFQRSVQLSVLGFVLSGLYACGSSGGSDSAPGPVVQAVAEKDVKANFKKQANEAATRSMSTSTGGPLPVAIAAGAVGDATSSFSATTIQEQGVDEDDLIKTNGSMIYTLSYAARPSPGKLTAYKRSADGVATKTAELPVGDSSYGLGMFLSDSAKRLAVLSALSYYNNADTISGVYFGSGYVRNKINLSIVDTANASALTESQSLQIDGLLVGTRMIGTTLYLVSSHSPSIDLQVNSIDALTLSDVLPLIKVGSAPAVPLVSDTDCYLQTKNAATDTAITTITAIDLASPSLARTSRCFLGGSEGIYVSEKNVYLATTRYTYTSGPTTATTSSGGAANTTLVAPSLAPVWRYPADIKTDIHKFSVAGSAIAYRASAEVPGHLGWDKSQKSYRMSEYQNDLRVLTFTGSQGWNFVPAVDITQQTSSSAAPSPATLSVLRESADGFKTVAALPNAQRPQSIGLPNEQVYAVRFLADRAFVVTFRRTDPLYSIDLGNPLDPKIVGELKAPGFSNYLFSIGRDLLLGVGQDANANGQTQGVKVGLIDVTDLSQPKELATRVIGRRGSMSSVDAGPHGISFFTVGDVTRVALPIRVNETVSSCCTSYSPTNQSLYRFEVNTNTKSLQDKTPILGTQFTGPNPYATPGIYDVLSIGYTRGLHIGDQVYFLNGGLLSTNNW
jgi:uncharacterized secreted protein with C-terminal beta-propeller domain